MGYRSVSASAAQGGCLDRTQGTAGPEGSVAHGTGPRGEGSRGACSLGAASEPQTRGEDGARSLPPQRHPRLPCPSPQVSRLLPTWPAQHSSCVLCLTPAPWLWPWSTRPLPRPRLVSRSRPRRGPVTVPTDCRLGPTLVMSPELAPSHRSCL